MASMTMEELKHDCDLWDQDVKPILGETDILIYPFGADIAGVEKYTGERYRELRRRGFRSFFLVDSSNKAWGQLEPGYFRGARINVDGITMGITLRGDRPVLDPFFDTASLVDPSRPETVHSPTYKYVAPPKPGKGGGAPASSAKATTTY